MAFKIGSTQTPVSDSIEYSNRAYYAYGVDAADTLVASGNGTCSSIYVYKYTTDALSGYVGLYDDSGNLLTSGTVNISGTGTGWQEIAVTPVSISSGSTYHPCWINLSGRCGFIYGTGNNFTRSSATTLPDPFTASADRSEIWSVYAEVAEGGGGVNLTGTSTTETQAIGLLSILATIAGQSNTATAGAGVITQILELAGQSSTLTTSAGQLTKSGIISLSGTSTTETIGNTSLNQLASLIGQASTETQGQAVIRQAANLIARSITQTSLQGDVTVIQLDVELSGLSTTATLERAIINIIEPLVILETYVSILKEVEIHNSKLLEVEQYTSILKETETYSSLV